MKNKQGKRWQNRYEQTLPRAAIAKLEQQHTLESAGKAKLARLLLKGKLSLADVLNKPPTPHERRKLI
jgi:hypothetical protein